MSDGKSRPTRWKYRPGDRFGVLVMGERLAGGRAVFACDCGGSKVLYVRNVAAGLSAHCGAAAAHPDLRRKGEAVTYSGAHGRTRAKRGRAGDQPCAHCGEPARDWAYRYGSTAQRADAQGREAGLLFSPRPEDYMPLCRPCHKRADDAAERVAPAGALSLVHHALWVARGVMTLDG